MLLKMSNDIIGLNNYQYIGITPYTDCLDTLKSKGIKRVLSLSNLVFEGISNFQRKLVFEEISDRPFSKDGLRPFPKDESTQDRILINTYILSKDDTLESDEDLSDLVQLMIELIAKKEKYYLWSTADAYMIPLTCFFMSYFRLSIQESIRKTGFMEKDVDDSKMGQIKRFIVPKKIIFCGDRHTSSNYIFEPMIKLELKNLPRYSTIIHGGCTGIDELVDTLARRIDKKFTIIKVDADWTLGVKAGPIRNKKMLDMNPDYVMAFHQDIKYSKGTKNMMQLAHDAGLPVYIHDINNKHTFLGNFEDI